MFSVVLVKLSALFVEMLLDAILLDNVVLVIILFVPNKAVFEIMSFDNDRLVILSVLLLSKINIVLVTTFCDTV